MKTRLTFSLFAFVGLLSASQSLLAAAPKTDARTTALVAALQAVSPDPLGGRLGLTVAGQSAVAKGAGQNLKVQSYSSQLEQRAYVVWKSSQKS
jgi:hypothetical protein